MGIHPICRGRLVVLQIRARVAATLAVAVLLVATPALAIGSFSPSVFKFVTTLKDDGRGKGGGWQEASGQLNFADASSLLPRFWSCHMRIGMPLRTVALGRISPESAAEMTADIATVASTKVMHRLPAALTGEFCVAFKEEMKRLFLEKYLDLGTRVNLQ